MPSISSKQPILNSTSFGDFGSISNDPPSGLRDLDGFERSNLGERFANIREYCYLKFKARNPLLRECLAELFGTFLFLSFGLASVAQFVFSGKTSFLSVNLSFGLGLAIAIIAVGKISGAHLNPAVSFSMLLLGRISGTRFFFYVIAQLLGAWFASLMVFLVYLNQLQRFHGGMFSIETAGIFATYPADVNDPTNTFSLFVDQFFATALFIMAILAITDKLNSEISHELVAILIGLSLTVIGASYGLNCGFAVNPARDFAPRIFTAMAGWGAKTFQAGHGFFWIPILAPMMGSFLGTISYSLFISNHWNPDDI